MADFRGKDWIRSAAARLAGRIRQVQSSCLKGITFVKDRSLNQLRKLNLRSGKYPRLAIGAAAAAVIALSAVIGNYYVKANTADYYKVYVNGELAGHVSSSDKVEEWLKAKAAELEAANTPVKYALNAEQVTYEADRKFKPKTDDEGVLAKLEEQVEIYPVGVEIMVNGEVVGVVRDHAAAQELLAKIKSAYVPEKAPVVQVAAAGGGAPRVQTLALSATDAKKTSAKPERLVESVDFMEKIDLLTVKLEEGELSDPDELYEKLTTGSPTPVQYVVQAGDCITCIAQKLKVSPKLIYEKNPWIEDDMLHIGDVLDLTELQPMVNVRSVEQVTQVETIEAPVEYKTSDEMRVGQTKVIRQGQDGQKQVTYRQIKKNGSVIEEEIVEEQILKEPVSAIILKGTKVVPGEGTGKFRWPVAGHRITSYQGERWGRMHKGIDIIGKSTIMAADNGVVEFAGYKKGGLGNAVIIDHKNGFKTVYAHLKSIKVKKGQVVEKGEAIGIMGSTGNSTGVHLHFEIYLNGKLKNPTSYLK
jgi:murein DD-endopeptidase MepM/ murein hydrolase activator NlpD/HEPN domain-containing protein